MRLRALLRARMAAWVRRRQGADVLPVTLQRRRLYILPTRSGVVFAVLLFLMLLAGLNYANSLALFFTFLFGGFALVAMHQCHRNLLGLCLLAADAPPTFVHRPGGLHLTFDNPGTLPRFRVEGAVLDGQPVATDIAAGTRQSISIPVPAPRRGRVHISRVRLATAHPFGLFRAWAWVHTPIEMLVYPRPRGALPMPAERAQKPGGRLSGSSGADEWEGLRPFRDGDSPRQVDWKAYAREAPLLVKEYSAAGSELRLFDFGKLRQLGTEGRLEQLARWVVDAEARGDTYGVVLPGTRIKPGRGAEHRHKCLAALALYGIEESPVEDTRGSRST